MIIFIEKSIQIKWLLVMTVAVVSFRGNPSEISGEMEVKKDV